MVYLDMAKIKLSKLDEQRLQTATARLCEAQETLDIVYENIHLKQRNAELEAWYAAYVQSGMDRIASDLNTAISLCKAQV